MASLLANIKDDGNEGQLQVAIAIIKMNPAPVVAISLNFGLDNHSDASLNGEVANHKSAIAALGNFFSTLKANGLEDRVTFAYLGVFGRNFRVPGLARRDHWGNHCTSVVIGKNVRAGIVSGTVPRGGDYLLVTNSFWRIGRASGQGESREKT